MTSKNKRNHNELSPLKQNDNLFHEGEVVEQKNDEIHDTIDLYQEKTRMKKVKLTKDLKRNRGFYFLPRKVIIEALEVRGTYLKPLTCNTRGEYYRKLPIFRERK